MEDEVKRFKWQQTIEVDHLGHVAAGSTIEFFDHPKTQAILKPRWVRDLKQVGTVTVSGDSLKDDGVNDGDVLIIKRVFETAEIRNGKRVVVLLPTGRSVVKKIYFKGDDVILRSANPNYEDMIFPKGEIVVQGIVKNLWRNFD